MQEKRPTISLTFRRKNKDVYRWLQQQKQEDEDFVMTDFLCDAVRSYWKRQEAQSEGLSLTAEQQAAMLSMLATKTEQPKEETEALRYAKQDEDSFSTLDEMDPMIFTAD